jgi:hypothetical protein
MAKFHATILSQSALPALLRRILLKEEGSIL